MFVWSVCLSVKVYVCLCVCSQLVYVMCDVISLGYRFLKASLEGIGDQRRSQQGI